MSAPPGASCAADGRPAGAAWTLPLLLAAGAWTAFDHAFDAGVLKTAVCALVAGLIVAPALAWGGREALAGWFMGTGGRLLLLSAACALPMALDALHHATVTDRLLLLGLANVAAVVGWSAQRARPSWLGWSVVLVAGFSAAVCLAQALGWESGLGGSVDEVVGLAGNTTRAGALCALGLVAVAGRLLGARGADGRPPAFSRSDLCASALGVLLAAALVLSRARAARWVTLVVVALLVLLALRRAGLPALRLRCAHLALVLGAGVAIAGAVGGVDALLGRKLDTQAPILSGRDPTTGVRLSLATGALEMIADRPGLGVGLGRYRQHAGAYRAADEAALPGLGGGVTEAEHPHNEVLLSFVEGGLAGGALLLLLLLSALRRAWGRARDGAGHACLADLGILLAGLALGLAQDAWTDPGTALIVYAALGATFAATTPRAPREPSPDSAPDLRPSIVPGLDASIDPKLGSSFGSTARPLLPAPLVAAAVLLGLGLALGAWPRLDAHLSMRSVYLRVAPEGKMSPETFGILERAADLAPTDLAVQRLTVSLGEQYLPIIVNDDGRDAVRASVHESLERLKALAPVPRPETPAAPTRPDR